MITADPRPMSSAPLDGTPVQLFAFLGSAIASFWTAERSRKAFGAGNYRAGWFLLDDEAVELNNPMGWEPLTHEMIAEKAWDFGEAEAAKNWALTPPPRWRRHRDLRRELRIHRQRARAAPACGGIEPGRPEVALLPDNVRIVLQLDGLAERERHRRRMKMGAA